jgi:hypothetical protein
MRLHLAHGLPFATGELIFEGRALTLANLLIDTGSQGTLLSADVVSLVGLRAAPEDAIREIFGIGGSEFIFTRRAERLSVGNLVLNDFEIEVGAMEYGLPMQGIIGIDFLREVRAVVDLARMEVRPAARQQRRRGET